MRTVLLAAQRAHEFARLIVCAAFTLLFTGITVRFAVSGGGMELVFLAAITVAFVFLTRHCYRRLRQSAREETAGRYP